MITLFIRLCTILENKISWLVWYILVGLNSDELVVGAEWAIVSTWNNIWSFCILFYIFQRKRLEHFFWYSSELIHCDVSFVDRWHPSGHVSGLKAENCWSCYQNPRRIWGANQWFWNKLREMTNFVCKHLHIFCI